MTVRNLSQPHDRLVRHVLSEPDLMADVMGSYIDAVVVSQIDLATLRCESPIDVDENLVQGRCSKTLWTIRRQEKWKIHGLRN